jgi:two-component system OmpR family response regulator
MPAPVPEVEALPDDRRLRWGDVSVKFTQREWPLVSYLLERTGQDISRKALIAEAWEMEGEVTENSVDVYVGYLRRKLTDAGLPLRIETVRGVGFRMESA